MKNIPSSPLNSPSTSKSPTENAAASYGLVRRSFLRRLGAVSAATLPAGMLFSPGVSTAQAKVAYDHRLRRGDAAILRLLAAVEIIESDLWEQYWELGGSPSNEFAPATSGNPLYSAALQILDGDMPQYITDNTDDEFSHAAFLLAYLRSRGASTIEPELLQSPVFRTLPGSQATGSTGKLRLTNLMQLNVDTSFWSRYRIDNQNPDLDPQFVFPEPVKIKNRTAIPRTDGDTGGSSLPDNISDHLKAIAFTAGFHFAAIEQEGSTLYPSLAQRVRDPEVLRILLSIGPTETMHFQTWQDKAGNATPVTDVDPFTGAPVTFVDLTSNQPEIFQSNLIMPEPCPFLRRSFPNCSIIRPTETEGAARNAIEGFIASGLFIGHEQRNPKIFDLLRDLAADADAAERDW